jgi:hypothetical protein
MNSIPGTHEPDRPPLPEGWVYTDDVEWSEPPPVGSGRRRLLLGAVVVLVAACLVGLVVANAQRHYSNGVAALLHGDYVQAQAEFNAASLVVVPYRDSAALAGQAGSEVQLEAERSFAADERESAVVGALERAASALTDRDAAQFMATLVTVSGGDLETVLRTDRAAQKAERALARGVTAIVKNALDKQDWGKAEVWTAALLALRPSSPEAEVFSEKVRKGRVLTARLADAKNAARHGDWRKALRLALGVTAVRKGFPGASSVVAEARRELAQERARARAAASAAAQAAANSSAAASGSSSSGSPSGSSSAPAPP